MRLNANCLRDLLIVIESNTSYKVGLTYPSDKFLALCEKYDDLTIRYHILQASKGRLLDIKSIDADEHIHIDDLSFEGHVFLASIEPDTTWEKIHKVLNKIGSVSIPLISQVSSGVLTSFIKSELNIN